MNSDDTQSPEFNRRDFLKGGSVATAMTLLGGVRLWSQEAAETESDAGQDGTKIKVAIIGLGTWGREILATLGRLPQADLAAICDHYPAFLRRSARKAPDAAQTGEYQAVLADKSIRAVIVATPTHQHREIALAALQAGKHVYCEAPLAHTIEDARAIAAAAQATPNQVFQAGLQLRADPQRRFLYPFIRSGALGAWVLARTQFNKKQSWRLTSPNPEREEEINWRLDAKWSLGLVGEIGIHHIDQFTWFSGKRPEAAGGMGGILHWRDGRAVSDTVQSVLEYPKGVNLYFNATLANSFDGEYEMYYGSDAAVLMRENSAWMFKEVDSPLLGWEVYAQKERFHRETGIVLKMGASKQQNLGSEEKQPTEPVKSPLHWALETFLHNANELDAAREDFTEVFGADDPDALAEHMGQVTRKPAAGFEEGYEATVTAIKAAEAIADGKRVVFEDEWYESA